MVGLHNGRARFERSCAVVSSEGLALNARHSAQPRLVVESDDGADEDAPDGVADAEALLDLRNWFPFHCSVIANRVSACLESMYGNRYELSVTGWRIMANLAQHAPLSARGLAEQTAMNHVQITRAVDQLVASGLVSRRMDAEDRRRIVLRLTRKGQAAYRQIAPLAKAIEAALLETLSKEERRSLLAASRKVLLRAEEILADGVDWRRFQRHDAP